MERPTGRCFVQECGNSVAGEAGGPADIADFINSGDHKPRNPSEQESRRQLNAGGSVRKLLVFLKTL